MIGAVGIAMCTSSCVVPSGHVAARGAAGPSVYSATTGLSVLPYGYRTHQVGGIAYFFHNNFWYTQRRGRYFRTGAPRGYSNYYRTNVKYSSQYSNNSNRRVYGGNSANARRTNNVNRNSAYRSRVVEQSRQDLQSRTNREVGTTNSKTRASRGSSSSNSNRYDRRSD